MLKGITVKNTLDVCNIIIFHIASGITNNIWEILHFCPPLLCCKRWFVCYFNWYIFKYVYKSLLTSSLSKLKFYMDWDAVYYCLSYDMTELRNWRSKHNELTFNLYPPCSFQVVYWEDDTKPDTVGKVRTTGNYTQINITGLKANTAYYLSVAAFNTAGPGPQSAPINNTTRKPREFMPGGSCSLPSAALVVLPKVNLTTVFRRSDARSATPAVNAEALRCPWSSNGLRRTQARLRCIGWNISASKCIKLFCTSFWTFMSKRRNVNVHFVWGGGFVTLCTHGRSAIKLPLHLSLIIDGCRYYLICLFVCLF